METKVSHSIIMHIDIQNFVNIHFKSPEVGQMMIDQNETGMLFFLYNNKVVSVLVCHDIEEGGFVL